MATDASEEGFAVAQSEWNVEAVKDCGRTLERSRWRMGAAAARSHAQIAGGVNFETHEIEDEMLALRLDRWEQDESFPEVPPGRLAASSWQLVRYGTFKYEAGILVLEARALERGVARLAQTSPCRNVRLLSLCDNMAVTLAVGRARARDFGLLVQIRQINAWCLLRNIKLCVRWVPSELNPSDSGSRMFGESYESRKDMTLVIDELSRQREGVKSSAPARSTLKSNGSQEDTDIGEERSSGASSPEGVTSASDSEHLDSELGTGGGAAPREAAAAAESESRSAVESATECSNSPRAEDPRVLCDAVSRASKYSSCSGLRKRGGRGRWRGRRQ